MYAMLSARYHVRLGSNDQDLWSFPKNALAGLSGRNSGGGWGELCIFLRVQTVPWRSLTLRTDL